MGTDSETKSVWKVESIDKNGLATISNFPEKETNPELRTKTIRVPLEHLEVATDCGGNVGMQAELLQMDLPAPFWSMTAYQMFQRRRLGARQPHLESHLKAIKKAYGMTL